MTAGLVVYEHDALFAADDDPPVGGAIVPRRVFTWLEARCLHDEDSPVRWLRLTRRCGRRAIQVTNHVGLIRTSCGYQIEVLPKIGKAMPVDQARDLLVGMLSCLGDFRHILADEASLAATRMPLHDVFIRHFLDATQALIRRGLRGGYVTRTGQLSCLRGKLLISDQIRRHSVRRDRFTAEFDDFEHDRPENRLLHTALRRVLDLCHCEELRRRARELRFVFADIPESPDIAGDLRLVRRERDMQHYERPLAWARLLLLGWNPLTGTGEHRAPSLLFPMEALFEAFVAHHLARQLSPGYRLRPQPRSHHLIDHLDRPWFQLRPDLVVAEGTDGGDQVVLDTKWKLIDAQRGNSQDKYLLSQGDLYQLHAYGHRYLKARGDVVLIYPKTDAFPDPLAPFHFHEQPDMRLWVLPFCLKTRALLLPEDSRLRRAFIVVG